MHGRENNEQIGVDEFGVSGYVYRNTFILFDRATRSLWYPLDDEKWTAISGPRQGETIPFMEEPSVIPLGQWKQFHPNTVVLLGDAAHVEAQ